MLWENFNYPEELKSVEFILFKETFKIYRNGRVFKKFKNCIKEKEFNLKDNKYTNLSIGFEGKVKIYSLHRIIAENFIPNPLNKEIVNHIDGKKSNNSADNLEWCTHHENLRHASFIGLYHPTTKLDENKIKKNIEVYKQKKKNKEFNWIEYDF